MAKGKTANSTPVTNQLRQAIAEQLLSGTSPSDLVDQLRGMGVAVGEAQREVQVARQSPYMLAAQGATVLSQQYHWLAEIGEKSLGMRMHSVERRGDLSAEQFFTDYYATGVPVIMSGLIDHWEALERWDTSYFARLLGDVQIELQLSRESDELYEVRKDAHRGQMRFADYLEWMRTNERSNDRYLTAYTSELNREVLAPLWRDIGDIRGYLRPHSTDEGSLWLGTCGAITPFHYDNANNLVTQIFGSKRFLLAAPHETRRMYAYDRYFSRIDGRQIDFKTHPLAREIKMYTVDVEAGEVLFIPVGWWHHVESRSPSAMVNFTSFVWDNTYNG